MAVAILLPLLALVSAVNFFKPSRAVLTFDGAPEHAVAAAHPKLGRFIHSKTGKPFAPEELEQFSRELAAKGERLKRWSDTTYEIVKAKPSAKTAEVADAIAENPTTSPNEAEKEAQQ